MTEADIKNEICQHLETLGDRVLFTVSPPKRTRYSSRYMRSGWPDVYGMRFTCAGGIPLPFLIEVKKPGGTLTLEQHKILERAKAMGAIAIVATCVQDVKNGGLK